MVLNTEYQRKVVNYIKLIIHRTFYVAVYSNVKIVVKLIVGQLISILSGMYKNMVLFQELNKLKLKFLVEDL